MNINTNMKLETWEKILIPSSVQSLGRVRLFATPWTAACEASLSITNSWSLLLSFLGMEKQLTGAISSIWSPREQANAKEFLPFDP